MLSVRKAQQTQGARTHHKSSRGGCSAARNRRWVHPHGTSTGRLSPAGWLSSSIRERDVVGWGRRAKSQQQSLGSGAGSQEINCDTHCSVHLSGGKLTCPHPALLPDWEKRDRFLQRAIWSADVSGAFGGAWASRGREAAVGGGRFSWQAAAHPAVVRATTANPFQP